MANEVDERVAEFGDAYAGFEPSNVQSLIKATGGWFERIVGDPEAVRLAMVALYRKIYGDDVDDQADWRELWDDLLDGLELPVAQKLVGLSGYAFFGLSPLEPADRDGNVERIRIRVQEIRDLFDAIPKGWAEVSDIERTLLAAEARLGLDTGEGVTPEQLAALAEINIRSMKNQLMPSSGSGLRLTEGGLIPAPDALRWIEARPNFRSSIWPMQSEFLGDAESEGPDDTLGEVLFAPVANDGTWFDPRLCQRAGAFWIGAKGSEERVADYRDALSKLASMKRPRWRRPNEAGHWGIVVARDDRWIRKTAAELGLAPLDSSP